MVQKFKKKARTLSCVSPEARRTKENLLVVSYFNLIQHGGEKVSRRLLTDHILAHYEPENLLKYGIPRFDLDYAAHHGHDLQPVMDTIVEKLDEQPELFYQRLARSIYYVEKHYTVRRLWKALDEFFPGAREFALSAGNLQGLPYQPEILALFKLYPHKARFKDVPPAFFDTLETHRYGKPTGAGRKQLWRASNGETPGLKIIHNWHRRKMR